MSTQPEEIKRMFRELDTVWQDFDGDATLQAYVQIKLRFRREGRLNTPDYYTLRRIHEVYA